MNGLGLTTDCGINYNDTFSHLKGRCWFWFAVRKLEIHDIQLLVKVMLFLHYTAFYVIGSLLRCDCIAPSL